MTPRPTGWCPRARWPSTRLGELAEIATRVIPGAGLAVERIGARAHDTATPQFVSSPGYEHAWLNPDNTEVSIEDLLSAPAIKLLIRKAGARSADMAAELAKHVGIEGDITYSTNNGLVEIVPLGISKATGVEEIARPLGIASDEVVAFGDMPNDVPMLLWAGHRGGDGQRASRRAGRRRRGHRAQHRRRGGAGAGTLVAWCDGVAPGRPGATAARTARAARSARSGTASTAAK